MGEQKAASFIDDVNNSTIEVMDKIKADSKNVKKNSMITVSLDSKDIKN